MQHLNWSSIELRLRRFKLPPEHLSPEGIGPGATSYSAGSATTCMRAAMACLRVWHCARAGLLRPPLGCALKWCGALPPACTGACAHAHPRAPNCACSWSVGSNPTPVVALGLLVQSVLATAPQGQWTPLCMGNRRRPPQCTVHRARPAYICTSSGAVKCDLKFGAFGGVPSGPACCPVGIAPLWLGAFGECACWRDVGLLAVSGFAGGKSFPGEALLEFCW